MTEKKLSFETLYEEKVGAIMQNISVLAEINESDTIVPPKFFERANNEVVKDFELKMKLLCKNRKFAVRELKKDHRIFRKLQKITRKRERAKWLAKANKKKKPVKKATHRAKRGVP